MKKSISENIADSLGVPKDIIMNLPRITVSGDREIYIENYQRLLCYTDTKITLSTSMGNLSIVGENFHIDIIRREAILISGVFTGISYEKKGEKNV